MSWSEIALRVFSYFWIILTPAILLILIVVVVVIGAWIRSKWNRHQLWRSGKR